MNDDSFLPDLPGQGWRKMGGRWAELCHVIAWATPPAHNVASQGCFVGVPNIHREEQTNGPPPLKVLKLSI